MKHKMLWVALVFVLSLSACSVKEKALDKDSVEVTEADVKQDNDQGDEATDYNKENYELIYTALTQEATETYSPYYEILGTEIVDYVENETEDEYSAIISFKVIHKNYDKDPDTVEYIKAAKERGSSEYQTLYDEYLQPKEMNMELMVVLKGEEMTVYSDKNPTEEREWVQFKMEDTIISNF